MYKTVKVINAFQGYPFKEKAARLFFLRMFLKDMIQVNRFRFCEKGGILLICQRFSVLFKGYNKSIILY